MPKFIVSVPSREEICQILRSMSGLVTRAKLLKQLGLTEKDEAIEGLDRRLDAMHRDGQIEMNAKKSVRLVATEHFIAGQVQSHKEGYGFLIRDDKADDMFIPAREMTKVWHGDKVLAKLGGVDHRGRQEAYILEVTERAKQKVVGQLSQENGRWFVRPDDPRIHHSIDVEAPKNKKDLGKVVMVELTKQPTRQFSARGVITEVLGQYDDPGMEIEIAVRKFDVPHLFSEKALDQAKSLPDHVLEQDFEGRYDLRDVPFVTIDGEDARDFDDAVFAQPTTIKVAGKNVPAWRLLVAIADVAHYVYEGCAIDDDARLRSTSVYFPRRVIPMLPEALSNGLCSLCPDVDRLALVCDMVIPVEGDKAGQVHAYQFYNAVIHSHARMTYNEVWGMVQGIEQELPAGHDELSEHVLGLYDLYQVLARSRRQRGAMEFETVETQIVTDEFGKIESIKPLVRNDAHRIIEECMLAANTSAADFMTRSKHPGLYRVHEGPTADRLQNLRSFLKASGLSLGGGEQPTPQDYAVLLKQIEGRPDQILIQSMCLRSLQQAVYTPDNQGHFGLAYSAYTHFTSPIRRYPDLLTHRVIKALLNTKRYLPQVTLKNNAVDLTPVEKNELLWEQLGAVCSQHERRADEASRDVQNWLKCWFMQDKVGVTYSGKITGITSFGIFVTLDDLYVEGLVHVTDLGADYFVLNEALHEIRGERTGKRYRLLDKLSVVVRNVSLDNRRIDFGLPGVLSKARPASPSPSSVKKHSGTKPKASAKNDKKASSGKKSSRRK